MGTQEKTILSSLREHIEVVKLSGNTINRMSILSKVTKDLPNVSMASVDSTRNYLSQAGYLLPSHKRGIYLIGKTIPKDLKMSELIYQAYPNRKMA